VLPAAAPKCDPARSGPRPSGGAGDTHTETPVQVDRTTRPTHHACTSCRRHAHQKHTPAHRRPNECSLPNLRRVIGIQSCTDHSRRDRVRVNACLHHGRLGVHRARCRNATPARAIRSSAAISWPRLWPPLTSLGVDSRRDDQGTAVHAPGRRSRNPFARVHRQRRRSILGRPATCYARAPTRTPRRAASQLDPAS
jgi:hypothetical protein